MLSVSLNLENKAKADAKNIISASKKRKTGTKKAELTSVSEHFEEGFNAVI